MSRLFISSPNSLVDAYKKCTTDARGAIECAGRAFEGFLRRIASTVGVDVSGKNGIGQDQAEIPYYRLAAYDFPKKAFILFIKNL